MPVEAVGSSIDRGTTDRVAELEASIQCRLGGQLREFRLLVHDQGLILRGHARTYYAKQLAQHAVMKSTGPRILANEIQVE